MKPFKIKLTGATAPQDFVIVEADTFAVTGAGALEILVMMDTGDPYGPQEQSILAYAPGVWASIEQVS